MGGFFILSPNSILTNVQAKKMKYLSIYTTIYRRWGMGRKPGVCKPTQITSTTSAGDNNVMIDTEYLSKFLSCSFH